MIDHRLWAVGQGGDVPELSQALDRLMSDRRLLGRLRWARPSILRKGSYRGDGAEQWNFRKVVNHGEQGRVAGPAAKFVRR
jgi:hypothetical protein